MCDIFHQNWEFPKILISKDIRKISIVIQSYVSNITFLYIANSILLKWSNFDRNLIRKISREWEKEKLDYFKRKPAFQPPKEVNQPSVPRLIALLLIATLIARLSMILFSKNWLLESEEVEQISESLRDDFSSGGIETRLNGI